MKLRSSALWMTVVLVAAVVAAPAAGQQMFQSCLGGKGVSAYLIAPASGVNELPKGWTRDAARSHANCMLAGESLVPAGDAAALVTTSYELPRADYDVALCCIGKARARIKGSEAWVDVSSPDSYFRWTRLGTARGATQVAVEIDPAGSSSFRYAGLLAEGSAMPVVPVERVVEKLRKGEPVTLCLMGDSVQENAKGFRGGSSTFETGVNGQLKAALEKEFGNEVSYVSHREPPGWPDDGSIEQLKQMGKVIELEGKTYRDGRVEFDAAKKIRLVNMAKGGAASNNGWLRVPESFTEANDWRGGGRRWTDTSDSKLPPVLRNGVAHYKPDLVFINFGTNDANGSHPPEKWTPEDYLFHMKVLATMVQHDLGAAVIVTTPHLWTQGTHLNPHTQPDMADAIRNYAKAAGLRLADVYNEYAPGEFDGIHPGDTGHAHLAEAYMKALLGKPSEPKVKARTTAAQLKDGGDGTVTDAASGLTWAKDAGAWGGLKTVEEAKAVVDAMNAEKKLGHDDWRLPTRDELLSLVDPAERPALPRGHPFANVQRQYLTSEVGMALRSGETFYWLVDMTHGIPYFPSGRAAPTGHVWPVRKAN